MRSLTTAHTLKSTDKSFKKFGITEGVYLEDVRFKSDYKFLKTEGDIILEIRKKDEDSNDVLGDVEYHEVWLESDIIEPVRIVISKLKLVNSKIAKLIEDRESEFKEKNIAISENVNEQFLENLKRAVFERYPREIEKVAYINGETVEYWQIQEIFDFINWHYKFGDNRDLKLKALQNIKRKELIQYAEEIQSMKLDNDSHYDLSSGISTEGINSYSNGKISGYLKWSRHYPELEKIEFWKDDLSGASQVNQVSNEVWGCLMLKGIQPELDKFFKLDWNTSLRQLYWQYLVALFVRQGCILQHEGTENEDSNGEFEDKNDGGEDESDLGEMME